MGNEVIPTLHIVADNLPQAHYRATKAVAESGMAIRTQYDRKNDGGNFIDPPSREASVLIEVKNPFNQPRYPAQSYCEVGKYVAEIMGVKDHLVLPYKQLKGELGGSGHLEATQWPYSYHQRLFAYPLADGTTLNQMKTLIDRLASDWTTRRAVASTRVPEIDCLLEEDLPCLGEVQLRCTEEGGDLYLHMGTRWRSRDLFKAWADNVVGLTFMQQVLAAELGSKMGKKVMVGSYSDFSHSLHLYGQDFSEKGVQTYINMGEDKVVGRAMSSDFAAENLVLPQLDELKGEPTWRFPESSIAIIDEIARGIKDGRWIA